MRTPPRPIRIVAFLSLAAIAIVVAATWLLLEQMRQRDLRHAIEEAAGLDKVLAEQTMRVLQSVDLVLTHGVRDELLEPRKGGRGLDESAMHQRLKSRLAGLPYISSIFVVGVDGRIAASSRYFPAPEAIWLGDRPYFFSHVDTPKLGLYTGSPSRNRVDGNWTLYLSRRLESRSGAFAGVIVAALDLSYFESLFAAVRLDDIHAIHLLSDDGTLIASQPRQVDRVGTALAPLPAVHETARVRIDGPAPLVASFRRVGGFPLLARIDVNEGAVLSASEQGGQVLIGGAALLILLILVAGTLLARGLGAEGRLTAALATNEKRLRALIDSALDAIVTVDRRNHIVMFNPAAERMFGHQREDVIGHPLDILLPERSREAHRQHLQSFAAAPGGFRAKNPQMNLVGRRADGSEFPIESTISRVEVEGDLLLTAILRDVSERRAADGELQRANRQLRSLSASLQAVREQERARIARELHDELGQQLTRLKMDLSWMTPRVGDPDLGAHVASMKGLIDETVTGLRRITAELRPTMLDDLGFVAAAKWLLEDFGRRTGVEVVARLDENQEAPFDDTVATALYRILQETLNNVARHAKARHVEAALRVSPVRITLAIADDGAGIAAERRRARDTFGLLGMRERARMIGGRLHVFGGVGRGTTVVVSVPRRASFSTEEAKS